MEGRVGDSRPPTPRDVYFSHFDEGYIERWSPGGPLNVNGGYQYVWMTTDLVDQEVIGMTDDGRWLYVVTFGGQVVRRIDMATGVADPHWEIRADDYGFHDGDMESITIRQRPGRTTLITGWADPANRTYDALGNRHGVYWAEWDINTRELVQAQNFVNASRGCDWVWMINQDEFVTGSESSEFWRINVVTLEETRYLQAPGSVSYTIEVRHGRFIAVTGNGGPIVTGRCNPITGHDPIVEQEITIAIPGIYFASSIESDGRYFWFSNYSGGDSTGRTPVYRVDTVTGEGKDAPIFHLANDYDTQGIYCPFRVHAFLLDAGAIDQHGIRFDPHSGQEPRGTRQAFGRPAPLSGW